MRRFELALNLVTLAVLCLVAWYTVRPALTEPKRATPPVPNEALETKGGARIGLPSATRAMVIFSDFECPFCERFTKLAWPTIRSRYVDSGKLMVLFRHFPLEKIHPDALRAGQYAECANRQGKFWPMHDLLFSNPRSLGEPNLLGFVNDLHLDSEVFAHCLDDPAVARAMSEDQEMGSRLGVKGTPTFFFGLVHADGKVQATSRLDGFAGLEKIQVELDRLVEGRSLAR